MNKKFFSILVLSTIFLLFVGVITISKRIDKKITDVQKTKVQPFEIGNEALVSNFPEFPLYPNAEIEWSKREGTINDYEGHWEVENVTPEEIVNWYVSYFHSDSSWEIIEPPPVKPINEMFMLVGKENNLYYITIEKYPDEDYSEIQVEIIPKALRGRS